MRLFLFLLAALLPLGAHAQIVVLNGLAHRHEAQPGGVFEGVIQVRNETEETQEVRVYQTDYRFYADGTNLYDEPGSTARSNAGWVGFSPNFLEIPPRQTLPVSFTVRVPAGAEPLVGTYWSMLMVEGIPKGSAESTQPADPKEKKLAISTSIRYGVQVITDIGSTGSRDLAFENPKFAADEAGDKFLQVDLVHAGERGVRPEVWIEVYDEQGNAQGRFEGTTYHIYPGTSVRQRIAFGNLKPGRYRALLFVDAGGNDIYGAQYTLQF